MASNELSSYELAKNMAATIHSYDQSYTAKAKRVRDALVEAATEQVAPA
jgi:hypothetical protein